jgi:hypothetical protein
LLGIFLVLIGALLVALAFPDLMGRVVAHERMALGHDPVVIGPYDLEGGTYAIWIEEYFPGNDDGDVFGAEAISKDGVLDDAWTNADYVTRTMDGVFCEQAVGWDHMPEGWWTFKIWTYDETTEGNAVHVFVVKEYDYGPAIVLGVGVVSVTLGLTMIGIIYHRHEKEKRG